MVSWIGRLVLNESGLETVEWAIVGGIIAAVGALVFANIGGDVQTGMIALSAASGLIP